MGLRVAKKGFWKPRVTTTWASDQMKYPARTFHTVRAARIKSLYKLINIIRIKNRIKKWRAPSCSFKLSEEISEEIFGKQLIAFISILFYSIFLLRKSQAHLYDVKKFLWIIIKNSTHIFNGTYFSLFSHPDTFGNIKYFHGI